MAKCAVLPAITTKHVDTCKDKKCHFMKHNNLIYQGKPELPWNLNGAKYVAAKLVHHRYYTIEYHQPQVAILPVVDNHSIVMVRVKRPIIDDNPLELPAGSAGKSEAPVSAAERELREETGIKINSLNRFQLLPSIAISPNRYPVLPWIYQIDISQNEFDIREQHDGEVENVECLGYEEVKRKILNGGIYISLAIAIVSRFFFSRM